MILAEQHSALERLLAPLEECLTLDSAQRIAALRADSTLQAEIDQLADKANAGTLTEDERSRYEQCLQFSQFVTLLQIRAREMIEAATSAA